LQPDLNRPTPVTDLGAGYYQGYQGGLYPFGLNVRPDSHTAAGTTIAHSLQPLDADGNVDPVNGKFVFASLGMSNTNQEFAAFITKALADPAVNNAKLILANGAVGGKDAKEWANSKNVVWKTFGSRIQDAGATDLQLQVVWIKQAVKDETNPFPTDAQNLKGNLISIVKNLKSKYPSVKLAYVSSRIYAYGAGTNPEPYAYEGAFATKWLIENQINGSADLAYTGDAPLAPWLSWGPYLWADGLGPDGVVGDPFGRLDGLEWLCSDFGTDGIHPSADGENKVADMLLNFFKTDPTTTPWFLAQ
jgi:hypothetical protein